MKNYLLCAFLNLCLLIFFIGATASAQVTFTQVDSGNTLGITNAGGLMGFAWGDYDGDGDLDFHMIGGSGLTGSASQSQLYRNDVSTSGLFEYVTGPSATDKGFFYDAGGVNSNGCMWGDFNGDGKLDLCAGSLRIFLNYGDSLAGMVDYFQRDGGSGGSWGITGSDFDNDGDLDIAFAGGTSSGGATNNGPAYIYVNDGNGVFTNQADALGVSFSYESWNPQWVDVNNDGWLDLWMPDIRTSEPCAIFMNESGSELVIADPLAIGINEPSAITSMWGDYDNDGDNDLFMIPFNTDTPAKARLYDNDGAGHFTDVAPAMDFADTIFTFSRSAAFFDYDNDGDLDLFIGRGAGSDPNLSLLYRNNLIEDGVVTFTNVTIESGINLANFDRRTVEAIDYNMDGWLDIFEMHNGTTDIPRLFKNQGGNSNHWIGFRLKSNQNNTAAIGARVEVFAGGKGQMRYVVAGAAGGSAGNPFPHFGLGSNTAIDSVVVEWPGTAQRHSVYTNVQVDAYNNIQEGPVGVERDDYNPSSYELLQNYPNPFNPSTTIAFNLPERSNVNILLYDALGKVVKEIASGDFAAGMHEVKLDASGIASGIYFYKMQAGRFISSKKLVLLK